MRALSGEITVGQAGESDALRMRPLSLAQYLLSVGDETLRRTGRILVGLASGPAEGRR
jgi:hypothetical protein